jgi:hypothetical protein
VAFNIAILNKKVKIAFASLDTMTIKSQLFASLVPQNARIAKFQEINAPFAIMITLE